MMQSTTTITPTPMAMFVNPKSGGQKGKNLITSLHKSSKQQQKQQQQKTNGEEVNGFIVCDLTVKSAEQWLQQLSQRHIEQIVVAGGDGSVRWVMSSLKPANMQSAEIATIPLGTGNDFSRITGWGKSHSGKISPKRFHSLVANCSPQNFDLWNVRLMIPEMEERREAMINYFSVGVDAKISLKFDQLRRNKPKLFKSSLTNKAIYGVLGGKHLLARRQDLAPIFQLKVDNTEIALPPKTVGIVVLNINSYSGGVKMWKQNSRKNFGACSFSDKKLEVVVFTSTMQLALSQVKLSHARQLAQGSCVELFVRPQTNNPNTTKLAYQVDGEPWEATAANVKVEHDVQLKVLCRTKLPKKNTDGDDQ